MQFILKGKKKRALNQVSFQSTEPYRGTVLSSVTLKGAEGRSGYARAQVWIRKKKTARKSLQYVKITMEPLLGWYPSKYASFKLSRKVDAVWVISLVTEEMNPSMWESRDGFAVLRVPKDWKHSIKRLFRKNGLCYSRTTNLWRKRQAYASWMKKMAKREGRRVKTES